MVRHIPFRMYDLRPKGPIVNVAFTIDAYCLDLLHRNGKNRSQTVRCAIMHYLGGEESVKDLLETRENLIEKVRELAIERKILRQIINSKLPNVDLEAKIEDSVNQVSSELDSAD